LNHKSYLLYFLFAILTLTINNPIKDRLFPQKSLSTISYLPPTILITPSENIRRIVWQGAIDLWRKFPLFGTGVETFAYSYYWTRPASHNLTSEWDFLYNKAHNEYLNYLATTGTFGFLTYLILIFSSLYLIHNTLYLIPFLSILITNFAGFSVVISSLYFYLLPILSLKPPIPSTPKTLKKSFLFLIILIPTFFLLQKVFYFYLADISYSQAENSDNSANLTKAHQQITTSLTYRPHEPLYLVKSSLIFAKLALSTKQTEFINQSVANANTALSISPANTNFWKERAQIYYYLSSLDTKYLSEIPNSLLKAAALAPTDAKTFYLLGQFYDTIKNYDPAIKYYQQAIHLKSNYDHATFALAKIYFDQKNYPQAKTYFESTLKIAPNNIEAKDYLEKISKSSSVIFSPTQR
jgi:tetratricopeptide (TPR) repeat protein